MKIAIGYKLKSSSWGGGNQFACSLAQSCIKKGYKVTYDLKQPDIDIILLTDPRSYAPTISFGSLDIILYLIFTNKNALVIHRINECDERKNTTYMNKFLRWANYSADYTVFIASWLKTLNLYHKEKPSKVILNGGDKEIFKNYNHNYWDGSSPLRIVTHHWSPNKMKGLDVYKELDNLLTDSKWRQRLEFTYVGNLPKGFKFKNAKHLKPMNGVNLGLELSKHHVYISASINEPAGMHHIEGALCGLPIIYRNSGALPEYCKKFGIIFQDQHFIPALKKMLKEYPKYKKNITKYPYDSERMNKEYLNLFSKLLNDRDQIIKKRNLFKKPIFLLFNIVFWILEIKNRLRLLNVINLKRFE